jgi:phosphocarrier protein HPr
MPRRMPGANISLSLRAYWQALHERGCIDTGCHHSQQYDAQLKVSKDGTEVGGTSIMGLMMLAAAPGDDIHISASGPQAHTALAAMVDLVTRKFDED